jgi:hypothetical protein
MPEPLPANVLQLHPDPLREHTARLDGLEERFRTLAQHLAEARPRPSRVMPAEFWREATRNLIEERLERWKNGRSFLEPVFAAFDAGAARGDAMGLGDLLDLAEDLAECRPLSVVTGGTAA